MRAGVGHAESWATLMRAGVGHVESWAVRTVMPGFQPLGVWWAANLGLRHTSDARGAVRPRLGYVAPLALGTFKAGEFG
jgi:hypothetical protein